MSVLLEVKMNQDATTLKFLRHPLSRKARMTPPAKDERLKAGSDNRVLVLRLICKNKL